MIYFIIINLIYIFFLNNYNKLNLSVIFTSLFIILFISFRFEVGGDWDVYKMNFDQYSSIGLIEGLKSISSKIPILIVYLFHDFIFIDEFAILSLIFCYFYIRYLKTLYH